MKLCFATNNRNKLIEVSSLLNDSIELLSLSDIGCLEEIEETQATIEGNSLQKAEYIFNKYNVAVFADDTGLEVEALNGEPGVKSARYAGELRDNEANIQLLLSNLKSKPNRDAQFKTVITLITEKEKVQFEGIVKGSIAEQKMGEEGFGYDPIFVPNEYNMSFAQMSMEEKNQISHRGLAVKKLVDYLNQNY
ncbi:non-canonical purine NTP diphosphatase [Fulvivirga lutimaris]|uniref:non-canonical purine NTP diphosphatase n=1 Tax=Fulvivirga lutimaris TaxID=1819566 RepID=UPI0016293AEF|nr:non-canonical purine NTP diphosphatase [Fulvivirga lutimaris]